MYQHALELEVLFEDHSIRSCTITDFLVLERVVHKQQALPQPLLTAQQLTNRKKRSSVSTRSQSHLRIATSEFALEVIDLTQVSGTIEFDDLLALTAAVCVYIKPQFTPRKRYFCSLPEQLTAFAALLVRR